MNFTTSPSVTNSRIEPPVLPLEPDATAAPQPEGLVADAGLEAANDERLLRDMAQRVAHFRIAHAAEVIADQVALSTPQGAQPAPAGNATRRSADFLRSP